MMPHVVWETPPAHPALLPGEIHVWSAALDHDPAPDEAILSRDEHARAARFVQKRDQVRYRVGRAALRMLLGRYQGCEPARLQFQYGAHGKPSLLDATPPCFFNVAHSCDRCLIAVTRAGEIGIDLERIRTDIDVLELAPLVLSDDPAVTLRQAAGELQRPLFYRYWVCKEAYVKALGTSISHVQEIAVKFGDEAGGGTAIGGSHPLVLLEVTPYPEYAAALCVPDPGLLLRFFHWGAANA